MNKTSKLFSEKLTNRFSKNGYRKKQKLKFVYTTINISNKYTKFQNSGILEINFDYENDFTIIPLKKYKIKIT